MPPALGWVLRGARLLVQDLFEHLAHARPHQIARRGRGVTVAPPGARRLARVEILLPALTGIVGHARIVRRTGARVNRLG